MMLSWRRFVAINLDSVQSVRLHLVVVQEGGSVGANASREFVCVTSGTAPLPR